MAKISASGRQPGRQDPQKYGGNVGPNYLKYGEQPGFVYIPSRDAYYENPKELQKQLEDQGAVDKPPKPDSLLETVGPLGASAAAIYGGKELGKSLFGGGSSGAAGATGTAAGEGSVISQGYEAVKNLFGFGSPGSVTGDTAINSFGRVGSVPYGPNLPTGMFYGPGGDPITGIGAELGPQGMFSFSNGGLLGEGAMPIGNYIPGVAGLFGAYDVLSNKKHGAAGALEGAASGAGIGFTLGGPVGAGIGAGVGGLVGYFGNFGDKDAYKTEWKRKKKLFDQGIITEQQLGPEPMKGRSRKELVEEAKRMGGNVEFAQTRDEKYLKAGDIAGYASVLEEADKRGIDPMVLAQQAVDAQAIREHHGTIDLDLGKIDGFINSGGSMATPAQTALNSLRPISDPMSPIGPIGSKVPPGGVITNGFQQLGNVNNAQVSNLPIVYDKNGYGHYENPSGGPAPAMLFYKPGSPAANQASQMYNGLGGLTGLPNNALIPAIAQGLQAKPGAQTTIVNGPTGMFSAGNTVLRSKTRSPGIDNQGRRINYA